MLYIMWWIAHRILLFTFYFLVLNIKHFLINIIMTADYPPQMKPLLQSKKMFLYLAYAFGFECTEPNWKFSIRTLISFLLMFHSSFSLCYTFYLCNTIFDFLETICIISVSAPVSQLHRWILLGYRRLAYA